jgi:hypothetical protein
MSMRSSIRIECATLALAVGLALSVTAAAADQRETTYNQAVKAGSLGQIEEAARLFCEVAKLDAGYKDAKQMCALMSQEAERERQKNDNRFNEGVRAFQEGRFDDAEQKFRNVRGGSHLDEAKQYLARIPAARAEKASSEAENAKFEQALQAYQRNDFAAAKTAFAQINGKRAREAQNHLAQISRYEQAISAGDSFASAGDHRQAIASYSEAINIKADGPGDPRAKLARVQSAQAAAAASAGSTPAPAVRQAQPEPVRTLPPPPALTAVKPTSPAVNTAKLMKEARAAEAKGQAGVASGKYVAVLASEPNNAAARRALDLLSAQNKPGREAAGSEADVMLAKAIREFYTGRFEEAEVHIKDDLSANGSKTALSHFYLGASKLTRYHLGGGDERNHKLLAEAQDEFRLARQTPGFQAPTERLVSPKILQTYEQSR